MPHKMTPELLATFMDEAAEQLAEIGPVAADLAAADKEQLKRAYRQSHNLKGSASLLGLSTLSHVARVQEEVLESLLSEERPPSDDVQQLINLAFEAVVQCVHTPFGEPLDDETILQRVFLPFRRFIGLPETGDATAIRELRPTPTVADVTPVKPLPATTTKAVTATTTDAKSKSKRSRGRKGKGTPTTTETGVVTTTTPPSTTQANGDTTFTSTSESGARTAAPKVSHAVVDPTLAETALLLDEMSSVGADFADIYAEESEEALQTLRAGLEELRADTSSAEAAQAVRRVMHNLKGASATVGFKAISRLAHRAENILDGIADGGTTVSDNLIPLLHAVANTMEDLAGREFQPEEMLRRFVELVSQLDAESARDSAAPVPAAHSDAPPHNNEIVVAAIVPTETRTRPLTNRLESLTPSLIDIDSVLTPNTLPQPTAPIESSTPIAAQAAVGDSVRVPIERLDALVRLVTELVVNRTSFEQRMQAMNGIVNELRFSLKRVQELSVKFAVEAETKMESGRIGMPWANAGRDMPAPPDSEFDPLELDRFNALHVLSRSLNEAATDINVVQNEFRNLAGDFDQLLGRQGLISRELQDRLMQARLVPLASLASRLSRTVRTAAEQVGKRVRLHLEGDSVPLDKTVLDGLLDPLSHLLRNAVAHGVETEELRVGHGKPVEAQIRLRAFHQGTQVVLQVSDDGRGLDLEALRERAVRDGHLSPASAESLAGTDLQNLIFIPGLSTAETVSELSGRGVGMDVVRTAVHKLKGTISVETTADRGTTFTIRLPMTLAITEALFVETAHEKFAIPLQDVLQIIRLDRKELARVGTAPVLRMDGRVFPLIHLCDALNLTASADDATAHIPVLFVNVGDRQVAFAVDRILATREIVVKSLGTHLRRVHGLIGATLMGDGTVVPILNCTELLETPVQRPTTAADDDDSDFRSGNFDAPITVMIVDDSVSVRRITQKILTKAGIETILCRDGVEALETLQRITAPPDLVLLDVEMPRMDGYELLSSLRAQPQYELLPVVMVTSRSGEKHRRKADELGATDYLVKPYDEEHLVALIHQHVTEVRELVTA